jgi:hypothetical protein
MTFFIVAAFCVFFTIALCILEYKRSESLYIPSLLIMAKLCAIYLVPAAIQAHEGYSAINHIHEFNQYKWKTLFILMLGYFSWISSFWIGEWYFKKQEYRAIFSFFLPAKEAVYSLSCIAFLILLAAIYIKIFSGSKTPFKGLGEINFLASHLSLVLGILLASTRRYFSLGLTLIVLFLFFRLGLSNRIGQGLDICFIILLLVIRRFSIKVNFKKLIAVSIFFLLILLCFKLLDFQGSRLNLFELLRFFIVQDLGRFDYLLGAVSRNVEGEVNPLYFIITHLPFSSMIPGWHEIIDAYTAIPIYWFRGNEVFLHGGLPFTPIGELFTAFGLPAVILNSVFLGFVSSRFYVMLISSEKIRGNDNNMLFGLFCCALFQNSLLNIIELQYFLSGLFLLGCFCKISYIKLR